MNLFSELREKRLFGVISKPEEILFEKVLILYEEQILRDSEKIMKNLREGKDTNCLYLNDNENSDDNNDEEPDEDSYNEIIELLTNTKIRSVYGDSNLFVIMQDVEICDKYRKILNINLTDEQLLRVINFHDNL